jgi:glutamate racemase
VITPEAHAAVQATRNRQIGLLATEATVASRRYELLVHTLDAGAHVTAVAAPKLVPLIEAGEHTVDAAREYAEPLKQAGCDTVILGCTHYPLIRPVFRTEGRWQRQRARRGVVPVPDDRRPDRVPRAGRALPAVADR